MGTVVTAPDAEVEAVARALYSETHTSGDRWEWAGQRERGWFKRCARAAIAALDDARKGTK